MQDVKWQMLGEINLCENAWPKFPTAPQLPGLYRITLPDGKTYIGQAEDIRHRLSEYRRPTGVEIEDWIFKCIIGARKGTLEVFTDGDLSDRRVRLELERHEIAAAKKPDIVLLNGKGTKDGERIRSQIDFHERHLARLRGRLSEIESANTK